MSLCLGLPAGVSASRFARYSGLRALRWADPLVVLAAQLRIHHTYETDFYIHVTSRAIIEHCDKVGLHAGGKREGAQEELQRTACIPLRCNDVLCCVASPACLSSLFDSTPLFFRCALRPTRTPTPSWTLTLRCVPVFVDAIGLTNGLRFQPSIACLLTPRSSCLSCLSIAPSPKTSGLDRGINNWHAVNDFLWIKPNQQSPHWSVLPEEQRCGLLSCAPAGAF